MKKVMIIINPISGHRQGMKALPQIESGLRKLHFEPIVLKTAKAGDAKSFAAEAPEGASYIVAIGGDGTLNEVLNGAVGRGIPLAVFPGGTANVFCKEVSIGASVKKFVSLFENEHVKQFDVGFANSRAFLAVCGAGFVSEVVRRLEAGRKGNIRMWKYFGPTVKAILHYDFPAIKVEVDGEIVCEDAMNVEVGNTASYGGPLTFLPLARPDDGLLDICIFRKMPRIAVFKHLLGSLTKLHLHFKETIYCKGKHVKLSTVGAAPTHVDGDGSNSLPAEYTISPLAVSMLVPEKVT